MKESSLQKFISMLMKSRRMSQAGIANAVGYSKETFSNIIRGKQITPSEFYLVLTTTFLLNKKEKESLEVALKKMPAIKTNIPEKILTFDNTELAMIEKPKLFNLCIEQAQYIAYLEQKLDKVCNAATVKKRVVK